MPVLDNFKTAPGSSTIRRLSLISSLAVLILLIPLSSMAGNDKNTHRGRVVKVTVDTMGTTAFDIKEYVPSTAPTIMRTAETINLSETPQTPGEPIDIEANVMDIGNNIEFVYLFFRRAPDQDFFDVLTMSNVQGDLYRGTIPAASAVSGAVDYYILAKTDVISISDPLFNPELEPYQIPLEPNVRAMIQHTPPAEYTVNSPITISAEITDDTDYVSSVMLYFKPSNLYFYKEIQMTNVGGNTYEGTIIGEFATPQGVDYYILAYDNYNLCTHLGTYEQPMKINPIETSCSLAPPGREPLFSPFTGKTRNDLTLTITQVDCARFPLVDVFAYVLDASGNPVNDLDRSNFTLVEDGTVQFIDTRIRITHSYISVALAMDLSGSMAGTKIANARAAAHDFIDNMNSLDRVAIIGFANFARLYRHFTGDKEVLHATVDSVVTGGATALYDGICMSLDETLGELGIKSVIVFTDGCENSSGRCSTGDPDDYSEVCILAQRYNIPVYTIGLTDYRSDNWQGECVISGNRKFYDRSDFCEPQLMGIANCSHGDYYEGESADLAAIYAEIAGYLDTSYNIRFISSDPSMTTPTPTFPPTHTPTPTPSPSATPTPVPPTNTPICPATGVFLEMPSHYFTPGDPCYLKAKICNISRTRLKDYPLFIVLDVWGAYYFAPRWTQDISFYVVDIAMRDYMTLDVLPEFQWPSVSGTASGVIFWGAVTTPEMDAVVGEYDSWEFGWGE